MRGCFKISRSLNDNEIKKIKENLVHKDLLYYFYIKDEYVRVTPHDGGSYGGYDEALTIIANTLKQLGHRLNGIIFDSKEVHSGGTHLLVCKDNTVSYIDLETINKEQWDLARSVSMHSVKDTWEQQDQDSDKYFKI